MGLTREGLTVELINKAREKLNAQITKRYAFRGEVISEFDDEDHATQLQAVRALGELLDQFGSRSDEAQRGQGTVIFVFPDWSRGPGQRDTLKAEGVGGPAADEPDDFVDAEVEALRPSTEDPYDIV